MSGDITSLSCQGYHLHRGKVVSGDITSWTELSRIPSAQRESCEW